MWPVQGSPPLRHIGSLRWLHPYAPSRNPCYTPHPYGTSCRIGSLHAMRSPMAAMHGPCHNRTASIRTSGNAALRLPRPCLKGMSFLFWLVRPSKFVAQQLLAFGVRTIGCECIVAPSVWGALKYIQTFAACAVL